MVEVFLAGYTAVDPAVGASFGEVLSERYRFCLVLRDAQLPAFADVLLVDRVERDEVGQVAYPIVVGILNGVNRDAVSPVLRADLHPPDGGHAFDPGTAEELFDAVTATQRSDGELPGEVTHPEKRSAEQLGSEPDQDVQSAQVPKISTVCPTSVKPCSAATRSAQRSTAGPATSTVLPQLRHTR